MLSSWIALSFAAVAQAAAPAPAILTQHGDTYRSGVNREEKILNVANVGSSFGKLWEYPVKDQVYAQPLYVPGMKRDLLIVASMSNIVYAFDADRAPTDPSHPAIWQTQLGAPIPEDRSGLPKSTQAFAGFLGVLSTPVIDAQKGMIYVVSYQLSPSNQALYRLYKLRLDNGAEIAHADVQGSLPGHGLDSVAGPSGSVVPFRPEMHLQRPGLLLLDGYVHLAFGSLGDHEPFHGWIFSYRASDLQGGASFVTTPNAQTEGGGGIWQSGGGLTADELGNVYVGAGNGAYSRDDQDWGDSVLKLQFSKVTGKFLVLDSFTPRDQESIDQGDMDLGAAGVLFIPPHLLLSAGKPGKFFLLDRNRLGGYHPDQKDDWALDEFQVTVPSPDHIRNGVPVWNIHGGPVFWDGMVYVMGESDPVKAFKLDLKSGKFDHTPAMQSKITGPIGMPGGFITLSSNGTDPKSGVVWVSHPYKDDATWSVVQGVLRAFDAKDLGHELWNSLKNPKDDYGMFAKFCPPTVANGHVYMATFSDKVVVYGLNGR